MTPMQNARMAVAGVAIALGILAGCSHSAFKPNDIGENGKPIWTSQSVSLHIEWYQIQDGLVIPLEATATAFWVQPGVMVTNAHCVIRATEIIAVTDNGEHLPIEAVLGLDMDADLALLQTKNRTVGTPVRLADADIDLRDFRGAPVASVAFLDGDLSIIEGRIATLRHEAGVGFPGIPELLHATELGNGASGGPVYLYGPGTVVGVNARKYTNPSRVAAIPAAQVLKLLNEVGGRPGVPLGGIFKPDLKLRSTIVWVTEATRCLEPGASLDVPIPVAGLTDLVFAVSSTDTTPLALDLHTTADAENKLWEGVISTGRFEAMTLFHPTEDQDELHFRASLPWWAGSEPCVTIAVGRMDWELAFERAIAARSNDHRPARPE